MLENKLIELKMPNIAGHINYWLEEAAKNVWPYDEFLLKLCDEELSHKKRVIKVQMV